MAKVLGPLLSLTATGSYGNLLLFSKNKDGATVQKIRNKPTKRSVRQQLHALKFKNASDTWLSLNDDVKTEWNKKAKKLSYGTGYRLWVAEWFAQNISSPNLPIIPA
jgi:hypothetical protein